MTFLVPDKAVKREGGVGETRVGLRVEEEAVDGAPREREVVADLEEELVGELELGGGEFGDESRGVLLLVEDCADAEEMVLVYWSDGCGWR
ncbi:hypothetical protein Bca52824_008906 [Brassica carinata]|uniref:Uncharacterized protein n=1 Tax=Brassica carinata TaxID=52824 RepID=A0A8X7W8Y7_BRACI|nr:hypothetical protein Bca52824_008906 [Brassica carinata]